MDLGTHLYLGVRKLKMIQQRRLKEKKKTFYFILVFQMTNNPGYSMNAPDM